VAALLFNVFLDFVVKQALASMPPDSGVSVQFRGDDNLLFSTSPEASLTLAQIALLLYVDDMVFFLLTPATWCGCCNAWMPLQSSFP
jgi:hypothetical protein